MHIRMHGWGWGRVQEINTYLFKPLVVNDPTEFFMKDQASPPKRQVFNEETIDIVGQKSGQHLLST